jgi:alpha-tubulin suppressor-like RCC1 family protein
VESDYELTPDQWEALKALRAPTRLVSSRFAVEQLVVLQLAAMDDGLPVITSMGRKVLVRGSSRLLDLVA